MAENKTKPTGASVAGYLAAIADEARRADCEALIELFSRATGEKAAMWGPGIVGFGTYHYKYPSGREGDSCVVGLSSRKDGISLYLASEFPQREALLAKLGKHKAAKACVTIKSVGDVDTAVLDKMVRASAAATRKRYPEKVEP